MESKYMGYAVITRDKANGAPVTKGTIVGVLDYEEFGDIRYEVISPRTSKNYSSKRPYRWYVAKAYCKDLCKEDLSELERIIFNIDV